MKATFIVLRPFQLSGAVCAVGQCVAIENSDLVLDLLSAGKIEAGDETTAQAFRLVPFKAWTSIDERSLNAGCTNAWPAGAFDKPVRRWG